MTHIHPSKHLTTLLSVLLAESVAHGVPYDELLATAPDSDSAADVQDFINHAEQLGIPSEWPQNRIGREPILGSLEGPLAACWKVANGELHFYYVKDIFPSLSFHEQIAKHWTGATDQEDEASLWRVHFGSHPIAQRLNRLNTKTLELFDAKVLPGDFPKLSDLTSVTRLGLPRIGAVYDEQFKLPPNIERLVVRTSLLNDHFFRAINQLERLDELVISKCSIVYPSPQVIGWGYTKDSWHGLPTPFEETCKSLSRLDLSACDPDVFNYLAQSRWPELESLHVTVYTGNMPAMRYLFESHPEVDNVFPSLRHLTLDVDVSAKQDLESTLRWYEMGNPESRIRIDMIPLD